MGRIYPRKLEAEKVETVLVEAEPVPVSVVTRAVTGSPSLVTLKENTEGPTMKIRIVRACNGWVEGETPEVNADYGRQLVENGLAEMVTTRSARTGKAGAASAGRQP